MKKFSIVCALVVVGLIMLGCKSEKTASSTTQKEAKTEKKDCDPGITFTATIQPILAAKCTKCHSGPTPAHRIDLTTLAGVQAAVGHNMLCTITTGPCPKMPPAGKGDKLTEEEVQQVQCWIDNGMKN